MSDEEYREVEKKMFAYRDKHALFWSIPPADVAVRNLFNYTFDGSVKQLRKNIVAHGWRVVVFLWYHHWLYI